MATISGTSTGGGRRRCAGTTFLPLMLRAGIAAGVVLAASWVISGTDRDALAPPRRLGAAGPLVFETANATIITDSRAKARWADARLREAITEFTDRFGVHPGHGVIVELPYLARLDALPADRKRWSLPWGSDHFRSGERGGAPATGHHFDNDTGIRHELNHVFLTAAFFPGRGAVRYGSSAPDWLDEAVAIAAESPAVQARRRGHFHQQVCGGRLVPLDTFLGQRHPLFQSATMRKLAGKGAGGAGMMVLRVDQLGLPRTALLDFYAQSQAVAEFLAETSGDRRILARVARAFAVRPGATGADALDDVLGRSAPPLAVRFKDWARVSAQAALPGCTATEPRA